MVISGCMKNTLDVFFDFTVFVCMVQYVKHNIQLHVIVLCTTTKMCMIKLKHF